MSVVVGMSLTLSTGKLVKLECNTAQPKRQVSLLLSLAASIGIVLIPTCLSHLIGTHSLICMAFEKSNYFKEKKGIGRCFSSLSQWLFLTCITSFPPPRTPKF